MTASPATSGARGAGAANRCLAGALRLLLSLRYRVKLIGRRRVLRRGRGGILLLANHPALIDPILLMSELTGDFAPRALADRDQVDRPLIRWLARRAGVRTIPDVTQYGSAAREAVRGQVAALAGDLRRGRNVLLYPSGRVYRSRYEDVGASSTAWRMLEEVPDARVVLVRTRGLWGSGFGWAAGHAPDLPRVLTRGAAALMAGGLVFAPRREVTIELLEWPAAERPRSRNEFNRALEAFYNADAPPNTRVPYTHFQADRTRVRPEPVRRRPRARAAARPQLRREVFSHLAEIAGIDAGSICENSRLAHDLGLDSLAAAEIAAWLEGRYGVLAPDAPALETAGDVLAAAAGEQSFSSAGDFRAVDDSWFARAAPRRRLDPPRGRTICQAVLDAAQAGPGRAIFADEISGVLRYREVIRGVLALRRPLRRLEGEAVGLMLPASAGAGVVYLATLFAGKTPVMVNWTVGPRALRQGLDSLNVRRVLTSEKLLARLEGQGMDLGGLRERMLPLERLRKQLGTVEKLLAAARARLSWRSLRRDGPGADDLAAVLFTSGSEAAPKAVGLTHRNVLTNVSDIARRLHLYSDDKLLGFLPPFHAFGLTVTTVLPLCLRLPTVYHANPNDAAVLAVLAARYRPTLSVGTPTFLSGMARAAEQGQLESLRLLVAGAEACTPSAAEQIRRAAPSAVLAEGYGVTECSPVVSVNSDLQPVEGSIGTVLDSLRWRLAHPETHEAVGPGEAGELLLAGPSVFGGYLNAGAADPFVELEGERWYATGDLVADRGGGLLEFRGRLKRFVKIGGEMVSLPLIEQVLAESWPGDEGAGPAVAVLADERGPRPQIVLFAAREISAEQANQRLRDAGLSPLHRVRRVEAVEEIPLLGTGKIDYRGLAERL